MSIESPKATPPEMEQKASNKLLHQISKSFFELGGAL